MIETHKRTIARAISYRIAALIITALMIGLSKAVSIHIVLTILYYICERLWLRISWGIVPNKQRGDNNE
jgi:uncharacterized membrane protein